MRRFQHCNTLFCLFLSNMLPQKNILGKNARFKTIVFGFLKRQFLVFGLITANFCWIQFSQIVVKPFISVKKKVSIKRFQLLPIDIYKIRYSGYAPMQVNVVFLAMDTLNSMVYFWTYAHPLYCPSDLQARGFNSCGWSDALQVGWARYKQHIGASGLLKTVAWTRVSRSDGHFSQVGWAFFVGRMGIFRPCSLACLQLSIYDRNN